MANPIPERESAAPWLRETKTWSVAPSIEKMPQFRSSLNRFTDAVGEALEALFGGDFTATFEAIDSTTTFELLASREGHLAALMHSETLNAAMLMIMDPRVVELVIGTMFGVENTLEALAATSDAAPRPRTPLENRLVGEVAKSLATALRNAFAPVAGFQLEFESVRTIEDTDLLGPRDMPAVSTRYTVKTPGGVFELTVALPQSMTTPLAHSFSRGSTEGGAQLDPNWTRRLEKGVTRAHMTLVAILDEFDLSLGELSRLSVGAVLPLTGDGDGRVRIECVERGVFVCKLSERNNRYALEVEDIIARPVEPPYPSPHP